MILFQCLRIKNHPKKKKKKIISLVKRSQRKRRLKKRNLRRRKSQKKLTSSSQITQTTFKISRRKAVQFWIWPKRPFSIRQIDQQFKIQELEMPTWSAQRGKSTRCRSLSTWTSKKESDVNSWQLLVKQRIQSSCGTQLWRSRMYLWERCPLMFKFIKKLKQEHLLKAWFLWNSTMNITSRIQNHNKCVEDVEELSFSR